MSWVLALDKVSMISHGGPLRKKAVLRLPNIIEKSYRKLLQDAILEVLAVVEREMM